MLDDYDSRFVFRNEQADEVAIRELGKTRAMCMCRVQFGRCKLRDCATCNIGINFRNCYDQLDDYNSARLSNYITKYYREYSRQPESWMSYKRLVKHTITWICALLFVIIAPFIIIYFMDPQDKPSSKIPADVTSKITHCLMYSQRRVYDRNLDQKVNCFDYAVTFKEQWDDMYPAYKSKCRLVRNKSARMNHLFAVIYFDGGSVCVETWAEDYRQWHMEDNWDSRYNPKYNIYNETERWMREVRW